MARASKVRPQGGILVEADDRKGKYRGIKVTGGRKEEGGCDRGGDRGTYTWNLNLNTLLHACLTNTNFVFGPVADGVWNCSHQAAVSVVVTFVFTITQVSGCHGAGGQGRNSKQ